MGYDFLIVKRTIGWSYDVYVEGTSYRGWRPTKRWAQRAGRRRRSNEAGPTD